MRCNPLPSSGSVLTFALLLANLSGCSMPEYRLMVSSIPADAVRLEVAPYLMMPGGGTIVPDPISTDGIAGRTEYKMTVDLLNDNDHPDRAVFSAIARNAKGCIIATGSSESLVPSSAVSDVPIELTLVTPRMGRSDRCKTTLPIIANVLRQELGPYGGSAFQLRVAGWGFLPTDQIIIRNSIPTTVTEINPAKSWWDANCLISSGTGCLSAPGPLTTYCFSQCKLPNPKSIYSGPGLFQVQLPAQLNSMPVGFPMQTSLASTLARPLNIVLSRAGNSTVSSSIDEEDASAFEIVTN